MDVAAPPVDGEANERLCGFLAKAVFGLPRGGVRVRAGASGRRKLLEVDLPKERVEEALSAWEARRA